jgi:hypothetical protein
MRSCVEADRAGTVKASTIQITNLFMATPILTQPVVVRNARNGPRVLASTEPLGSVRVTALKKSVKPLVETIAGTHSAGSPLPTAAEVPRPRQQSNVPSMPGSAKNYLGFYPRSECRIGGLRH